MLKTTIIFNVQRVFRFVNEGFLNLLHKMAFERYFLWFPIFFGMGIFFVFDRFFYKSWYIYYVISFIPFLFYKNCRRICYAVLIGGIVASLHLYRLSDHRMLDHEIEFIKLKGVIEKTEFIQHGTRVTVMTDIGRLKLSSLIKNVPEEVWHPGNEIRFKARLYPFLDNNIGYNFWRQAFFEQCYSKGVILAKPYVVKKVERTEWAIWLENIRNYINAKINRDFSEDTKGIAEALITGDKGQIPLYVRDNYAKSGIAHILAISGLHITMIAGLIYFLLLYFILMLPKIPLRYNVKKIAMLLSFIGALFYVFIAGMRIPAIRALIMYGVITIAVLADRTAISLRNVAIAAIVILALLPESINNPGFYMSFFVVAALISYYENRTVKEGYFQGIVRSSVIASLAVIPFSWYFFNQVVSNGISANLLSIPLLGVVIMPALMGYVFGIDCFGFIAVWGIKCMNLIAELVAALDWLFFRFSTPDFFVMVLGVFGVLLMIINKQKILGAGVISVSILLYSFLPKPFLFVRNDFQVFGIRDGESFFVNDMIRSRSMTNLWRQISGALSKKKLKKLSENKFQSDHYTITALPNAINISPINVSINKTEGNKKLNIIIKK